MRPAVRRVIPKVRLFTITKGEREQYGVIVSEQCRQRGIIPVAFFRFDHLGQAERMRRLLCSELQLPIMQGVV